MSGGGIGIAILIFIWYVCISIGIYHGTDYRIRAFLREQWLCWVFSFMWPISIVGFMFAYMWEENEVARS